MGGLVSRGRRQEDNGAGDQAVPGAVSYGANAGDRRKSLGIPGYRIPPQGALGCRGTPTFAPALSFDGPRGYFSLGGGGISEKRIKRNHKGRKS